MRNVCLRLRNARGNDGLLHVLVSLTHFNRVKNRFGKRGYLINDNRKQEHTTRNLQKSYRKARFLTSAFKFDLESKQSWDLRAVRLFEINHGKLANYLNKPKLDFFPKRVRLWQQNG